MNLDELQQVVDSWIRDHGGYFTDFQVLARLTEELGEIAAALQRNQGLRPRKTETDIEGEIGDLLFTLAVFANITGVKLDQAIAKVLEKYNVRDSAAWRGQGT